MDKLVDLELGRPTETDPPPNRPSGRGRGPLILLVLLLAGGAGALLWWQFGSEETPPPPLLQPAPPSPPAPAPEVPREEPAAELELPPLDRSDPLLRELLAGLADHPQLARWLTPDGLARRFVAAIDNVAEGLTPRKHFPSLVPSQSFAVVEREGRLYAAPESFQRYDAMAAFFTSLDTEATARLYRSLEPLFDEAYRDLGYPDRDFRQTLGQAIQRLLQTPVPASETALVEGLASYDYADPRLQGLTPAQRQLLRMGPRNVRRVQAKLREIAASLGL